MPVSGVVIRWNDADSEARVRAELATCAGITLGDGASCALAAVVEAPDYPAHDALLARIMQTHGVCAVDIIHHDFSDVSEFPRLPVRQRNVR